jgi:IS5 family transposase
MTQMSFSDAEYAGKRKRTRREAFLSEMDKVVPWDALLMLIEPHYPKAGKGRHPYPIKTMLRIHFMQQWFGYSDPAMEEALYDVAPVRKFANLSLSSGNVPDETTILNFRRLLEQHGLAEKILAAVNRHLDARGLLLRQGTVIDATIIHAPSSTKNQDGERDPQMRQTKKGNQYYFGMKAHIGVDVESGLVHTVTTTPANSADVTQAEHLLHGKEESVWADAGYTGADKREALRDRNIQWQIAAKRGKVKAMPAGKLKEATRWVEYLKAAVRAKVEHPFRVIKRQFGYTKVRYRGLAKNHSQVLTLFALSNLWMARRRLMAVAG